MFLYLGQLTPAYTALYNCIKVAQQLQAKQFEIYTRKSSLFYFQVKNHFIFCLLSLYLKRDYQLAWSLIQEAVSLSRSLPNAFFKEQARLILASCRFEYHFFLQVFEKATVVSLSKKDNEQHFTIIAAELSKIYERREDVPSSFSLHTSIQSPKKSQQLGSSR